MTTVLVVDDDLSMREFLTLMLEAEGYEVSMAANGQEALGLARRFHYDLVVSDIRMKEIDGIEVLKRIKSINPNTVVILISAFATAETAVVAMNEGAFDFFPKPFKVEELKAVVRRALAHGSVEAERARRQEDMKGVHHFGSLVGSSPAMLKVYDLIPRTALTPTNVLITGESGTGKELVARAIHDNSPRAKNNFVTINCGGMPEQLVESELFGHKRGAFTGATNDHPGLFEVASRGTLFLDEVGELSPPIQVKLLRAVQEKTYRPVGGMEERKVDVRIISATNKDLEQEVMAGRFREDLYYRLNVIHIKMPPLREREGDLPLLAYHFLEKYSRELGKEVWKISSYALSILSRYDFPGNVRELENIVQRSVALEQSNIILPESLTLGSLRRRQEGPDPVETASASRAARSGPAAPALVAGDLDESLAWLETRLLLSALAQTGGARRETARLLSTSQRSLRYRLSKFGLDTLSPTQIARRHEQVERKAQEFAPGPLKVAWRPEGLDLEAVLAEAEAALIGQALEACQGVRQEAARLLGVSQRSLRYRLGKADTSPE